MKNTILIKRFPNTAIQLSLIVTGIALLTSAGTIAQSSLEEKFKSPPDYAKPRGYWIWAHGNYDYTTIRNELTAFKEAGLGGMDIFDIGVKDRLDIIPPGPAFMSEEQLDGIEYALSLAGELDMAIGLIVSSSWNAGGSWTQPEDATMNLVVWTDTLDGPINRLIDIPFPDVPDSFSKPYGEYALDVPKGADGLPLYYQDVALLAFPLGKDGVIQDTSRIVDLGKLYPGEDSKTVKLPEGRWVIMRAVNTPFGQKLWVASDNSGGYIIDHFSKSATRNHFKYIIDRLKNRVGDLGESALERFYLASYESEADIMWTPKLPEEFKKRNGYELKPFIPALLGTMVVDKEHTERFLYDYRKTISDLFVENHYQEARTICHENGILICSESGGPGPPLHNVPTEDLKALGAVDIMRGEFWNRLVRWKDEKGLNVSQVVKNIASAAHIYGHKVVEMESFTSQTRHWKEGPFELKPLADKAFAEGMTRVVYHTMPHNPPEAGIPGWSYQAGTHIGTSLTWWPMISEFNSYLARSSTLLMEGQFVADVAYYYGNDIPNFAKPKHIRPDLGQGYDYDDLNTEILLQTTEVINGKIKLPHGMMYEVLVLPEDSRMDLPVLKKIEELLEKGATIIGPKPERIYGLAGFPVSEILLKQLADKIWGKSNRKKKSERSYGKGKIITGKTAREVLLDKGIHPDFQYDPGGQDITIDYIHRNNGVEDIYFIRNVDSTRVLFDAIFRVKDKTPEIWDQVSGKISKCAIYRKEGGAIRLPLELEPFGSVFVVFTMPSVSQPRHIKAIEMKGEQIFPFDEKSSDHASVRYNVHYAAEQSIVFDADKPGAYTITFDNGKQTKLAVAENSKSITLQGPWDVRFPAEWVSNPIQQWDSLSSWTESLDTLVKYFSGIATYRKSFELSEAPHEKSAQMRLDLGKVGEVARVYLNGQEFGVSLFPPHRFDVSAFVKMGMNHLVIEVANTMHNRLVGDLKKPVSERKTRSNVTSGPGPNDRYWRGKPLQSSGLMGPVELQIKTQYIVSVSK